MSERSFWEKPLAELTESEWEALCDRCGRCCLHKFENRQTGEILFTNVVCRYYDVEKHRCTIYGKRTRKVPDCLDLKERFPPLSWLPETCAYRLRTEGKPLPPWHPLLTGTIQSVQQAGICVSSFAVPETQVKDLRRYLRSLLRARR